MPFFAANISDGFMFGKKPIQDRIASCRSLEFEAIEINNPYNTSPSHLASLLQNEETGESLQLVSIDTYNGPIDAPISCYAENNISDFINFNNPALSDNSDSSSIATTTQASLAYLNSDHKLFPRDKLDGYASIPGTLFAYNNSLNTTFTYASIINVPCVNILPGTLSGNPFNTAIFNDIMSNLSIIHVNNTDVEYHHPLCPSCIQSMNDNQQLPISTISTIQQTAIKTNPVYQILQPSAVEQQHLTCCPPHSMVVSIKIPLYLTQSLTIPTVSPTILAIIPLPHLQTMNNIVNNPSSTPNSSSTTTTATTTTTPPSTSSTTCQVLAKHYSYLTKTQHLNNKSYFLMKKLLPSSFLSENAHNLFDVFHNSFYIHEVVELYQHYYSELYRILNLSSQHTQTGVKPTATSNSSSSPFPSHLDDKLTLFQHLVALSQEYHNNSLHPQSPLSKQSSLDLPDQQDQQDHEQQQQQPPPNKDVDQKFNPSPFLGLCFPTHTAYTPQQNSSNQSFSTSSTQPTSLMSPVPQTDNNMTSQSQQQPPPQQQPQTSSSLSIQLMDLSSPRFDYFLTSIIFTTLIFNVKLAARNAARHEQLSDTLSLTLSIVPQTYLTTLFRLLRVLVFCSSDNIGILYDTSAIYSQHGNIIALFERLSPLIRHVKVSNIHPELDNTILFNSIHQLNYTGWVCLDFGLANTTIPTKKILQPWFPHYLRRRNGSAGVLFMCRGKQGKVYVLLGQETKHGQKTVGPFWGRPDKTDIDIEMTAVRETIEESLGCVVNNPTVLYSALKNKGFFYKCPRINLYLVNIGVLGVKERNEVVARYSWLRHTILTNTKLNNSESIAIIQQPHNQKNPLPSTPLQLDSNTNRDKHLAKSLMEMNEVIWVDLYDMYRHYMLKSYRLLSEYGIVIDSPLSNGSPIDGKGVGVVDDDDTKKDKKKGKKDKDKKSKKDKKNNSNDDDNDDDEPSSPNTAVNGVERETTILQPPHNNEHTITSLINTVTQQRGNYNNLPLRRFFIREMLYMWLIDPNWLNLVHKREFNIHSIERLIQLHQQQVDKNKQQQQHQQQQQQQQQQQSRPPRVSSPNIDDEDVDHKQWRSAPL